MAKVKLPDALSRRHLLEGGLDSAKAFAVAQAYLDEGREIEAVDFLAAAGPGTYSDAREALEELQRRSLERGDVFLMRSASGALGEEPNSETWRALAETASSAGRSKDAETAERLATIGN